MSATATVQQTKPTVSFFKRGRRPEEQGYTFGDVSLTLSDLQDCESFVELQNKGVPESICRAARNAGYMPSEIDEYLDSLT